jgi:hypothetical protein
MSTCVTDQVESFEKGMLTVNDESAFCKSIDGVMSFAMQNDT